MRHPPPCTGVGQHLVHRPTCTAIRGSTSTKYQARTTQHHLPLCATIRDTVQYMQDNTLTLHRTQLLPRPVEYVCRQACLSLMGGPLQPGLAHHTHMTRAHEPTGCTMLEGALVCWQPGGPAVLLVSPIAAPVHSQMSLLQSPTHVIGSAHTAAESSNTYQHISTCAAHPALPRDKDDHVRREDNACRPGRTPSAAAALMDVLGAGSRVCAAQCCAVKLTT
jgi:hypothetical protein